MGGTGLDLSGLGYGPATGGFEKGYEFFFSQNAGNLLSVLKTF
jgi:hypothetical protein